MADKISTIDQARQEAADWLARLNSPTVSAASVVEFWTWRRDSRNAAAYASIEVGWKRAMSLKANPELHKLIQRVSSAEGSAKLSIS